jgi:tRNA(Ile2)-agmatinylcytidine synthase
LVLVHIGVDDTDSPRGGCTTYLAALLVEKLTPLVKFTDYPNLVRLNPNIQWKTRGNGAICLRFEFSEDNISEIQEIVIRIVEKNSDIGYERTDPGIVFLQGPIPNAVLEFGTCCLRDILTKAKALKVLKHSHAVGVGYGSGWGLIGALAAVGNPLIGDHTYEFLAYRRPKNRGSTRKVDHDSVLRMDEITKGTTFNNVDWGSKRILITPHGSDPVLVGIRGESPVTVKEAFLQISLGEEVERWVIFRTNQGTEAHLLPVDKIASAKPRCPITIEGTVSQTPESIPGRHVIFKMSDASGEICVAAYEPSGGLRKVVRELRVGDHVRVFGGVRPAEAIRPLTVNLEKLEVLDTIQEIAYHNPICPACGRHMESMGKNGGYRCRRCGFREHIDQPFSSPVTRKIEKGLYLPPPRSQRHLSKPLDRYGLEKLYIPLVPKDFWGLGYPREGIP